MPITAPRLDLDPSEQSLLLPPETVEGEPGPLIYHVDPSAFEEKPWRRPGADLTDWFNYGFNEESWKLWGEKKHNRTKERGQMEANGGRHDGRVDDGDEQSEVGVGCRRVDRLSTAECRLPSVCAQLYRQQQQNDDGSSNYMSQMQPQQMQVMQAMMGASGLSMSPEQMMAFMGMGPGGVPGGMGMPGGGMMNNMPGMGAMFGGGGGGPQNANQGMFPNTFGGMPNMPKMHQPSPFQRGTPANGPFEGANEAGNDGGGLQQGDVNGEWTATVVAAHALPHAFSADQLCSCSFSFRRRHCERKHQRGRWTDRQLIDGEYVGWEQVQGRAELVIPFHHPLQPQDNAALGGEEPLRGARAGMTIQGRGAGVPGAPTGPSRGGPPPKGPSADRGANATAALPNNVPTGPKNPGRRYNDRDTGLGAADPLDYGGGQGGNRDDSDGRSPVVQRSGVPRSPGGRSSSLRRQQSNESREPSTERNRERESERERDWGDDGGNRSSRRARERTGERRRHGSTDDELERLARREQPSSRREQERGQRYSGGGGRRADYREERRKSDSVDRDDEWEKDSVASSASRRRASSRQQAAPSRSSGRADRRRGEADSGEDTERDRKHDRSQMRAERRAGRDGGDEAKQSGRKRNAPDDDHSPVRSTSSRKRR